MYKRDVAIIADHAAKSPEGYDVNHLDRDRTILESLGVW